MLGYVYLIGSSLFGWYKIGKSKTPETRVENLGILLPFKIEVFAIWKAENYSLMEEALHEKYAAHHINGEWFSFDHKKVKTIVHEEIPEKTRIYPKEGRVDTVFSSFSNIESDAPEGKSIKIKVKNYRSEEERIVLEAAGKAKSAIKKAERLAKQKELDERLELLKSLEAKFVLNTI